MVYISSPTITSASRQSVMQAQSDLAKAQKELSSGVHADAGLTLGARSGQLVSLSAEQNKLQTITDGNALTSTRLSATVSSLSTIQATATKFLSALAATTAGNNPSGAATTALGNLGALTAVLNTTVAGGAIFGGINTDGQPIASYSQSPASATKQAVDDAFMKAFGTSQTASAAASLDPLAVQSFLQGGFADLFSPSGFASGWSKASDETLTSQISASQTATTSVSANATAFRQLAQAYVMVGEFGTGTLSAGSTAAVIASATTLVQKAISGLTDIQTGVGITQSAIADANTSMASQMSVLSTQFETLDGVDAYALTTKVSSLQTQIEASYELTAKLQSMSLVNYLA